MPTRRSVSSRAPTEIDKMVGDRIRNLRYDHDMTLSELGAELGISHQQLQKYETGVNRLSAGMLYNVANVFRVPIGELFELMSDQCADQSDPLQKTRAECILVIERTKSADTLRAMTRVLKAMQAN